MKYSLIFLFFFASLKLAKTAVPSVRFRNKNEGNNAPRVLAQGTVSKFPGNPCLLKPSVTHTTPVTQATAVKPGGYIEVRELLT